MRAFILTDIKYKEVIDASSSVAICWLIERPQVLDVDHC